MPIETKLLHAIPWSSDESNQQMRMQRYKYNLSKPRAEVSKIKEKKPIGIETSFCKQSLDFLVAIGTFPSLFYWNLYFFFIFLWNFYFLFTFPENSAFSLLFYWNLLYFLYSVLFYWIASFLCTFLTFLLKFVLSFHFSIEIFTSLHLSIAIFTFSFPENYTFSTLFDWNLCVLFTFLLNCLFSHYFLLTFQFKSVLCLVTVDGTLHSHFTLPPKPPPLLYFSIETSNPTPRPLEISTSSLLSHRNLHFHFTFLLKSLLSDCFCIDIFFLYTFLWKSLLAHLLSE